MNTPFRDFAGSTVVHTVGGMVALTGAIALGPRLGRKFKRDGGGMWPGHDMTIAAVGGVILWFGWYGFNPGSTLSAMDFEGIGRVATNTTLAACAGGLIAMFFVYPRVQDVGHRHDGATASSAASSPSPRRATGCQPARRHHHRRASPASSSRSASTSSSGCASTIPIGAVAVHGFCGIWGTLSIGLFAAGLSGLPGPNGADNDDGGHRPLLRRRHRPARHPGHR